MSSVDYNTGVGVGALGTKCTLASECTAVGYNAMNSVTTGGNNTAIGPQCLPNITAGFNSIGLGFWAGQEVTTGHGYTLIGTASALALTMGYDNTVVGNNTNVYADDCSESIVLGSWCTNTASNQLYVSPSITSFNISGLTTSTGTGTRTILEFNSSGNIIPSVGTYNAVLAIDAIIATINAPYAMSWVANTIYTYDSGSTVQAPTIWDTLNFGNSANMATKSTWMCPAAGLWHIAATFGFSMSSNDQHCSFQLYHNGAEVWYFTDWYNIATAGEGITTQCKSIFLNLAVGDTLEWYLLLGGSISMTIGGVTIIPAILHSTPSGLRQVIPLHKNLNYFFLRQA